MSELDTYLAEAIQLGIDDDNFDILAWWKINDPKYLILAAMARDILGIPVSTVSVTSEAAFSTAGRVLYDYRSSLNPKTVEALICTQDWLRIQAKDQKNEILTIPQASYVDGDFYVHIIPPISNGDKLSQEEVLMFNGVHGTSGLL